MVGEAWVSIGALGRALALSALIAGPSLGTVTGCTEQSAAGRDPASDTTLALLLAELQPAVERSSGLTARTPPRLASSSRETLEAYLLGQLAEQLPPPQAAAVTAAYARFGLVPDTLDLYEVLVALYEEQVVGYYDPRADTLFVLDHVDADQLEVVLVHELVHSLQDQYENLDSLTRTLSGHNDRGTAAQAAIEGHATLAMVEWQMGRMLGQEVDVTQLPDLGDQLSGVDISALGEAAGLPVLADVPRVLQEALIFPYVGGLAFVQRLWRERGARVLPFGADLPSSTEQLLHWERFAGPTRDEPREVTFSEAPAGGWEEVYADGLGELETRIFLAEHLGDEVRAAAAAEGWDGDRFRLLRGPEGEALIWASAWDSREDADEFAAAAREALARRYGSADAAERRLSVERPPGDDPPAVLILDLPTALEADASWGAARFRIGGE